MGILLNPDNTNFKRALNSQIYVDKSEIIAFTNSLMYTNQQNICVSRPRRFGKSMAADMLVAYYSKGCDSRELFSKLKIAKNPTFDVHLNKYNVIHIVMTNYIGKYENIKLDIQTVYKRLIYEIRKQNSDVDCFDWDDIFSVLEDVFAEKKVPFVFIIDEWDCAFRIKKSNNDVTFYLNFLRNLLKDKPYVALAYMTGILPIKKYGEHSALNMFDEYSMTNQRELAEFTGFTEDEVRALCKDFNMSYDETKKWYDGYSVNGLSIYSPRSVVSSMTSRVYDNYWTSTETYEALKIYIQMNYDGLKDKVTKMISGEHIPVNTRTFQNDMTTFNCADDVLTLLIHLGYLTYDFHTKTTWIPNNEVQDEFISSISTGGWEEVINSIKASDELLRATLDRDAEKVAEMLEKSHTENSSILKYNDENSLACVISLAYYSARVKYIMHRELATGKGYADIVYIPRRNVDLPALVIELKHNKPTNTAIEQIKNKQYNEKISEYSGEILLVGVSYDDNKKHSCVIERILK